MSDATNTGDDVPDWGGRVLIVAAHADPDVAEFPATGKVAAIVHGEHRYHRVVDAVEHAGPD